LTTLTKKRFNAQSQFGKTSRYRTAAATRQVELLRRFAVDIYRCYISPLAWNWRMMVPTDVCDCDRRDAIIDYRRRTNPTRRLLTGVTTLE
jgi:hypothetical protein